MSLTLENRPTLSPRQVQDFIGDHYGLEGSLTPLPAEWDQNFRLDSGRRGVFVVKIANHGRSPRLVDFENAAMEHLSGGWSSACSPRVEPSRRGARIAEIEDDAGRPHLLRVLSWIEGGPLSSIPIPDERPFEELGTVLGELDQRLSDFTHPAMDRNKRRAGAFRLPFGRRTRIHIRSRC